MEVNTQICRLLTLINRVLSDKVYNGTPDVQALAMSLSACLKAMPIFGGRIKRTENKLVVYPGSEGVPLDVYQCHDFSVASLLFQTTPHAGSQFCLQTSLGKLVSHVATGNDLLKDEPLLQVRVTHMTDGWVLAVSVSHALCDGMGYYSFLHNWSRLHRGLAAEPSTAQRPPVLFKSFQPSWLRRWQCLLLMYLRRHWAPVFGAQLCCLRVNARRLLQLKREAGRALVSQPWISKQDALTAYMAAALGSPALMVAVNMRRKPGQGVDDNYTGNASGGVLVMNPSAERIRSHLQAEYTGVSTALLLHLYVRDYRLLRVSAWTSFVQPHTLDFGSGSPRLHRPAQMEDCMTGHLTDAAHLVLMPTCDDSGDIELVGSLTVSEARRLTTALNNPVLALGVE